MIVNNIVRDQTSICLGFRALFFLAGNKYWLGTIYLSEYFFDLMFVHGVPRCDSSQTYDYGSGKKIVLQS